MKIEGNNLIVENCSNSESNKRIKFVHHHSLFAGNLTIFTESIRYSLLLVANFLL